MGGGEIDFHALARRDLQSLCKKNQIAANTTNIAMADALASLPCVEGLEEFLHPTEDNAGQSLEKENPLSQVFTRSMTRASTRRRTALEPESEQLSSHTTARRSMRNRNAEMAYQESKVLIFAETPAISRTKKRAEAASVQPKVEKEESENNDEGDVIDERTAVNTMAKTRQGKTWASVTQLTRVYTRRSTRLLEKSMNDLKLCDHVIRDLEPVKMGDLAVEKDLTEEPEDAINDECVSESAQTVAEENPEESKGEIKALPLAEFVSCEVEALVESENQIEVEEESRLSEICYKSETQAAESEDDAPIEVESSESNLPNSQLLTTVQDKESNKVENETWEEDLCDFGQICRWTKSNSSEMYSKIEAVTLEVKEMIGLGNEMGTEKESRLSESKIQEFQGIANDKSDELDEFSAGGLTSIEEAAAEYGYTELEGKVAVTNGDSVPELTEKVTSLNLDCHKDNNEDIDSQIITNAAVHDVSACFMEDSKNSHYGDDNVVLDGYLAENDVGKNGDGISDKLDIHGATLSQKQNNAVPNSTEEIELCHDIGQLHDVNVTEAEKFAMELEHWNKRSIENVDVRVISGVKFVEAKLQEDIFSEKTPASIEKMNRVPPSPLTDGRLTELPEMQLEDNNKENRGDESKVGKEKITDLLIAEDDNQKQPTPLCKMSLGQLKKRMLRQKTKENNNKESRGDGSEVRKEKVMDLLIAEDDNQKQPTPLCKKSLGELKKMLREKAKMQNEKKLVLQILPENHVAAVVGEADD